MLGNLDHGVDLASLKIVLALYSNLFAIYLLGVKVLALSAWVAGVFTRSCLSVCYFWVSCITYLQKKCELH